MAELNAQVGLIATRMLSASTARAICESQLASASDDPEFQHYLAKGKSLHALYYASARQCPLPSSRKLLGATMSKLIYCFAGV
jgi:hypothetical protein